jgi:Sulfotransferase family
MLDPFPFIVARGRSGTTLLRAMFDSHPQMAVPPESHFVVPLLKRRRSLERRGMLSIEAFVADLGNRYGFRRWELDVATVEDHLRASGPVDLPTAIRDVFALYADRQGKARYAEKTPVNVLHLELLATTFPEARFVHLIRDGRDVALSYLDADFGATSVPEAAVHWRRFVREGRRAGAVLGPGRYREVRYEDLIAGPEDVLRSLCDFLELSFDPAMLTYHTRAGDLLRTTSHQEHHGRIALPPTSGLRDWRRDMGARDLAAFEAIAGDVLDDVGYDRGVSDIPDDARRAARRARIVVVFQRGRDQIRRAVKARRRGSPRTATASDGPSAAASLSSTDHARNTGGAQ